jgi:hypothetical protein
MKNLIRFFVLLTLLFPFHLFAGDPDEILEQQSDGVRKLVDQVNKTYHARDPYSAPEGLFIMEGCYGGKKGDEFSNSVVDMKALYYSEIFKKNTGKVTRVHAVFNKPVSVAAAQNTLAEFVPFLRGRTPTQESKISPSEVIGECSPKNGGTEKRFTRDYFIEFYYAPGSKLVQEARMWNANYNN